jgi:integrase
MMKVRNFNENTDNYLKKNYFYFNIYKTSKTYGKQKVKLPPELMKYIKAWTKVNKNDFLLFNSADNHLTSSQITKILNRIFDDKHVSVDMLRHVYLSTFYKGLPELKHMEDIATQMGHSFVTALSQYVKTD